MSKDDEKKNSHSFMGDVTKTVTAGAIMLVCTTLYNLVLAHIWPVTIHFREYSLNNFIFILVSIISSILLAVLILEAEAREARIVLRDPVYGTGRAYVVLRPVNLLHLEQLVTGAKTMKNERESADFAWQLAFGENGRYNF